MRAACLNDDHRPLEAVERAIPEPMHQCDVVVRVGGAGVCGRFREGDVTGRAVLVP